MIELVCTRGIREKSVNIPMLLKPFKYFQRKNIADLSFVWFLNHKFPSVLMTGVSSYGTLRRLLFLLLSRNINQRFSAASLRLTGLASLPLPLMALSRFGTLDWAN